MILLKNPRILLFFLIVLITACTKENLDEIVVEDPDYQPETVEVNSLILALRSNTPTGLDLGCVTIEFPFDLLLESGSTITITSEDDFDAASNQDPSDPVVDFVFPLNVSYNDGNPTQVANINELGNLFGSCIPTDGWDDAHNSNGTFTIPAFLFEELCFDLVYPVDVEDADENAYTANNETELIDLIATTTNLSFILPITVVDDEGTQTTIESVAGFYDLYYACDGVSHPGTENGTVIDLSDLEGTDCNFETLSIQFPYEVETEDGELITVQDENQEAALILSGVYYTVKYPFSLVDENGGVTTINNEAEFIQLILPCIIDIGDPADPCEVTDAHVLLFFNGLNILTVNKYPYDINFPVTLIVDGAPVVVNSGDEYLPAVGGSPFNVKPAEIVYPVTVTQFGRDIVLNNDDEVCQFYKTLDEPCENKPAHIQFFFSGGSGSPSDCAYFITYPLEIVRNGATIQVQSRDDYLAELNTPGGYDEIELVYPVRATKFSNNQQITFGSDDAICDYLTSCQ